MEVSSSNKDNEISELSVDIDETIIKDIKDDFTPTEIEKSLTDEISNPINQSLDYDDGDDSGDDIAVITQTSSADYSSPAKNKFSIKTAANVQATSTYKMSKTAIDLDHPGNVNGVPTIDYDMNKLTDDCKPWKKPGADVSDFFNYGFTEETWLMYCEKQKANRLIHDNTSTKQLSGFTNLPYNLSSSHINVAFNRNNTKLTNDGSIDVIGSQQNSDFKNKHNDQNVVNNISTIPVQTGHMNINLNQPNNYMSGFALNNNLLNPLMSAIALGMLPNHGSAPFLNNGLIDSKMGPYQPIDSGLRTYGPSNNSNWNNTKKTERNSSAERTHVNDDYNDRKSSYIRSDRSSRRNDHEESRQHRSYDKREKSTEKHHRSRSNSRDRGHDSKYSRSTKRKRSSDDSRRRSKYSRERSKDRVSSDGSRKGHHKSSRNHRHSKSRSPESTDKKSRRRKAKSPAHVTKPDKDESEKTVATGTIKKEKDLPPSCD